MVRTSYLNHPIFKKLLVESEEMYGYDLFDPIAIPCNIKVFKEILRFSSKKMVPRLKGSWWRYGILGWILAKYPCGFHLDLSFTTPRASACKGRSKIM